jgi:hypothetical protein
MENKEKPYIPAYDREPSSKGFRRAILGSLIFIVIYGGVLIWKNYYKEGVKPPLERQQLSVPSYFEDSTSTDTLTK